MAMQNHRPVYRARVDIVPVVLEFLGGLRADDILTELVQNDLDQGAQETHVRLTRNALVAEGNGRPVDETGWERLAFLLGAGGEVEAKRNGIGVKNHGLRSCFALGDEIVVRSAGRRTSLTLAAPGTVKRRINPGALEHPVADRDAPSAGARIEVPYRRRPLLDPDGADSGLCVPGPEEIERLFHEVVEQAPSRFLGCVRPAVVSRYVLTLEHWRLGTCVLTYRCGPTRRKGGFQGFRRECQVKHADGRAEVIREDAVLFQPRRAVRLGRVPRYYRAGRRVLCEVSWATGPDGRPVARSGRLRYPIAYPMDGSDARTEIGASFSAPFVSDTARHGLAPGVRSQNEPLLEDCERALVRIVREYLLPVYGVSGLVVLEDPERPQSDRCRRLVAAAASTGALPAARGTVMPRRANPRAVDLVPPPRGGMPSFLITTYRDHSSERPAPLPALAPRNWTQLHPGVPAFVRQALLDLVSGDMAGLPFLTFDDHDVVTRLRGRVDADAWFPWASADEWRRDVGNPLRARLYLDVLRRAVLLSSIGDNEVAEIREHAYLPDRDGVFTPWGELWRHKGDIPEVPGVIPPRCVHAALEKHPLLVTGQLALKAFKLSDYVVRANFVTAGSTARANFFAWFSHGEHELTPEAMEHLRTQPIWPTVRGEQVTFGELCAPLPALRRVLADQLNVPAPSVLAIRRVRTDGRGRLRLRTRPNADELRAWWISASASFPLDRALVPTERQAWRALERDLLTLRADARLRGEMPWLDSVPGLCRDDWLRAVTQVHLPNPVVNACRLLESDRLTDAGPSGLYAHLGARTRPSASAIIRALTSDSESQDALFPRLAGLELARRGGEAIPVDVSGIPFLEVDGVRYPPQRVALRSVRDYWGAWRVHYPVDQPSVDRQRHLRAVGVAGRVPDPSLSREFFTWLSMQGESVLLDHLDMVIRHFLLDQGPLSWWEAYPGIPCLPVLAFGRQLRLLTRKEAFTRANAALLPDFAMLERQVLIRDRRRRIVVTESSGVQDSAMSLLMESGLRTLRQTVMPPASVRTASAGIRDELLSARLEVLRGERFASALKKRLQEIHVPRGIIRRTWQHDIRLFEEVRVAHGLEACFRLGRHDYWLPVSSAADLIRKTLWVSADTLSPAEAFFTALAERVFEAGAPPYFAFALQAAMAAGYEARIDLPEVRQPMPPSEEIREPPESQESGGDWRKDVKPAHSTEKADQMATQPSPRPVPPQPLLGAGESRQRKRHSGANRPESSAEKAAIDELKERHYAWHCQACLAAARPDQLAPAGSYAHRPLHRRAFVVGHHVDQVQGGGARWVSNVLVLCQYHHGQLGDQLEHPVISEALTRGTARSLRFAAPGAPSVTVEGVLAEIGLDSEPYRTELFFTVPHAEAWRAK